MINLIVGFVDGFVVGFAVMFLIYKIIAANKAAKKESEPSEVPAPKFKVEEIREELDEWVIPETHKFHLNDGTIITVKDELKMVTKSQLRHCLVTGLVLTAETYPGRNLTAILKYTELANQNRTVKIWDDQNFFEVGDYIIARNSVKYIESSKDEALKTKKVVVRDTLVPLC